MRALRTILCGLAAAALLGAAACGAEGAGSPESVAREQVVALALGVTAFERDLGRFPTADEGLAALVACPPGVDAARWKGPYLLPAEVPPDPWGRPYAYALCAGDPERPFAVYSCGPDGASVTAGRDADDIGLWAADAPAAGAPELALVRALATKQLRRPLVLVLGLLVVVALLRVYAGRVAAQPQPHPGGYVRRYQRRRQRSQRAGWGSAEGPRGHDGTPPEPPSGSGPAKR